VSFLEFLQALNCFNPRTVPLTEVIESVEPLYTYSRPKQILSIPCNEIFIGEESFIDDYSDDSLDLGEEYILVQDKNLVDRYNA
jgi:hypothetical protein